MKIPRKELVWYFDPVSPYTYLFINRLVSTIKPKYGNLKITTVPVLFAGLLDAHGQRGPAEIPSKREYIFVDCLRAAHLSSIPFKMPPAHPFNPLLALRCLVSVDEEEARFQMSRGLLHACWGLGKDLTKHETILEVASKCRLDGHALFKLSTEKQAKEKLRANTQAAVQAGVFGVPTAVVDGDAMFWGSDRIEHMDFYLDGRLKNLDTSLLLNELATLPRGSDRKAIRNEPK